MSLFLAFRFSSGCFAFIVLISVSKPLKTLIRQHDLWFLNWVYTVCKVPIQVSDLKKVMADFDVNYDTAVFDRFYNVCETFSQTIKNGKGILMIINSLKKSCHL